MNCPRCKGCLIIESMDSGNPSSRRCLNCGHRIYDNLPADPVTIKGGAQLPTAQWWKDQRGVRGRNE